MRPRTKAEGSPSRGGPTGETPSVPQSPAAIPTIPDYDLIRRIGGGAYGEVWLARSKATGVLRAAKIVWRHTFEDGRPFEREFEGIQKFERISRDHPSQLALFHIGRNEAGGCFYYMMELADSATPEAGPIDYTAHTLRADLEKGRLPAAKVLEIGLALNEALSHLHANGLVHRDVKPSNVIFVNGRPKLADIGLVTDASDQCSIVGTEGYLPPEGPGTPQADIFALGKVLYEAATGLDRREFPKLPDGLRTWPDAEQVFELNEIILKACAPDLKQRYQSCQEMQADLGLLEQGKSVKQKRTQQQRLNVLKKTLVAAFGFILLATSAMILSRKIVPIDPYPDGPPSKNMEANKFCEKAFLAIQGDNYDAFPVAYTNFHQAIKLDPQFVRPYAGLLELLLREGNPNVNAEPDELHKTAGKLITLAPHLAAAYCARSILCYDNWDFPAATHFAFQATRANPEYELGRTWYGYVLTMTGQPGEGRAQIQASLALAPSKASTFGCLGLTYFAERDFTNFFKWEREAIELEPHQSGGYKFMGDAFQEMGDYTNALDCFEKADRLNGKDEAETQRYYGELRRALDRGGISAYWRQEWKLTEINPNTDFYWKAIIQIHLGNTNTALNLLNQSFNIREKNGSHGNLDELLFDVHWDCLRDNLRFKHLLDKVGFTKVMPQKPG